MKVVTPVPPSLFQAFAGNWGAFLLRGVAAILFGVLAWGWPALTLTALVLLYAVYALADGIISIVVGVRGRDGPYALLGLLSLAAGIAVLLLPRLTALLLVYLIAGWALVIGVLEIITAIRLRRQIEGEWLMALAGLLWLLFAGYLIAFPGAGAVSLVWLIGTWAIVLGLLQIALALRLRRWSRGGGPTPA